MYILYLYLLLNAVAIIMFFLRKPSKSIRLNGLLFLLNFNTFVTLCTLLCVEIILEIVPYNSEQKVQVQLIVFFLVGLFILKFFVYKFIKDFKSITFYTIIAQIAIIVFGLIIFVIYISADLNFIEHLIILSIYFFYILVAHLMLQLIEQKQSELHNQNNRNRIAEDMIPIINQIRRVQHDYANILSGLVDNESIDQSYKNIVFHQKNPNQFEAFGKVAPMIQTALYLKSKQLEEANIEFLIYTWFDSVEIYTVNPKEYEIVTIIINLINNGVEAMKRKELEEPTIIKKIIVKISINKGILEIKVGNSGKTVDPAKFERWLEIGYTSKTDGYHGFGLNTVQMLTQKYLGNIQLEQEHEEEVDYIVVTL